MAFLNAKTGKQLKLNTGYQSNPVDYQTFVKQQEAKRQSAASASPAARAADVSKLDTSARPSTVSLQNQLRQAQADLDTDAMMRINRQLKEERARQGKQTVGDRVSDALSSIFSGSAGGYANAAGTVAEGVKTPGSTLGPEARQRSAARLQASLDAGRTTDGKPISPAQRKSIQEAITRLSGGAEPPGFAAKAYQTADMLQGDSARFQQQAKEGLGKVGSLVVDAGISTGQSLLDNALGAATGTGMLPFVARSFGGAAQEARQSGADTSQQLAYGAGQAAKEFVTEKLFGLTGPQRLTGGGSLDDAIETGIRNTTERLAKTAKGQKALGVLMTWLSGGATEGAEEVIGSVLENTLVNPFLRAFDPDGRTARQKFEDGLYDALVGAASGLMGGVTSLGYQANPQTGARTAQNAAQGVPGARLEAGKGLDTTQAQNAARTAQTGPENIFTQTADAIREEGDRQVRETVELMQRAAGMETGQQETAPGTETVKPGIMEQELQRLFGGGKRLSPDSLTAEQMAAAEAANASGTVDMDAENRLYQVNPEEHIDRRDVQSAGDKQLRAFQFDHPQLHPYYVQAAETLAAELEHYIPGGETASRVSEDGNAYSYRMGRSATPRIAELIDRYGVKPAQIGNAIDAIIKDRGQENYAAAKRLELLLDDMLTGGYQDAVTGKFIPPNQEYIAMKREIAGAADGQASPGSGLDGIGAADAGFTTRGMEGKERTSRMAQSHPYNKAQEAATAMTREEYDRLFRYQSQTEAKTTHLAEELVYVLQNGKKTFLKDVDEAAYDALKESLQEATAWNAEQAEAAKMIELELLGRSYNSEITSEEYTDWLKTVREHGTSTGQGIQAFAKWTRADNNRGQATASQAVETIQNSKLSDAQKQARTREVMDFTKRINDVQEGNTRQLEDIILEISKKRGTTTGPVAKRLDGVLRKAMDSLTFQELKQFAFSSTEALSTDTKPLNPGEAVKTIQVLNMLSSLKTPGRNLTGNTAFYGLDALSMDGAALLDMALANITGTRSVAMGGSPINRAMWENAIKSAKMSTLETALDVDMGSGETMYGTGGQRTFRAGAQHEGKTGKALNFTERVLSALERNNSFLLTVPDEFFKGMARGNEANIQRLIDQGKIKTEDASYAAKQADELAKYRTFQDTNAASAISSGIHDLLNLIGKGDSGKKIKGLTVRSFGFGDFVSPFSRVAANLAARGVDYNPVTAVRGVVEMGTILYDAKRGKTIDPARQAKAVSRTARGLSGTAVIGGFLALLAGGLIRRADDEGDENVAALNRSEGRTGYQFNLSAAKRWMNGEGQKWQNGDKLLDISSLQPFNELLGVADQIYHDEEKSAKSLLIDDVLGMMYAAADIPVLQTAGDLAKDLTLYKKDPVEAFSEAAVNTAVSSVTPNILRSVAQGLDDRPRSINREDGLWRLIQDEFKSRFPGLRQTLPGGVDPTGADKTYPGSRVGNFLNSTLNPMGLNTYEQTEQSQEWQRLREETGRTDFYPSNRIPKKLAGNGLSKDLSYEERQDFQRDRGIWLMLTVSEMMGNQGYKRAGSGQQSDLMKDARDFAQEAAKRSVLGPDSVSKWVNGALEAQQKTGLSPSTVIYYKDMLSREGENQNSSEAKQTVRNAIQKDSSLNAAQKNALDDIIISDVIVIPDEKDVDYSSENSFVVSQMSESAVKHWPLVQEAMPGITGEQYQTAWDINNRKGTKQDPYTKSEKKQDIRDELDLTTQEVNRLLDLMVKAAKRK